VNVPGRSYAPAAGIALAAFVVSPAGAVADEPAAALPDVVVFTSPLAGTPINGDKVPGLVQSVSARDMTDASTSSLNGALSARIGSINLNDNAGSAFQADVLFRGFAASPVLGTPQGLAVYQNGVRINEAFGDAVNWDLVPDAAIDRVDVVSANPVYGLNALGGAIAIRMKDGFRFQGMEFATSGGSFGERTATVQFGGRDGEMALYGAIRAFADDGWRRMSAERVDQAYIVASMHGEATALDLAYTRSANVLAGQGAAPIQELALDRALVFTGPQRNANRLDLVSLNASWQASEALSAQGVLYSRRYRQGVDNGNRTSYVQCATLASILCQPDGVTPLRDPGGAPLADPTGGGEQPLGENDRERIDAAGRGFSLQLTSTARVLGRGSELTAGLSIDQASVDFESSAELGPIDPAVQVLPTGLAVWTPEDTPWPATPVRLHARHTYSGLYATETLDLTPALALTASARYNVADLVLRDRLGSALTGTSRYSHFNPAIGLAWRWRPALTLYAGLARNTRAPTASEIECSDPQRPCLLPSSLAGDPPNLRQVIVRTLEAGVRGRLRGRGARPSRLDWHAGIFRSDLDDDIYGVATGTGSGYFRNIGATRREGAEAGLDVEAASWSAFASYALLRATFEDTVALPSPDNPLADSNGIVTVHPGNRLPGLPRQRIKAGVTRALGVRGSVGVTLTAVGPSYLHGDEANQSAPLPGYAVVGLNAEWHASERVTFSATVRNLFNARYATFGLFADPTGVGAPGVPSDGADPRFVTPAAPFAVIAGVRVRL
jgi:iron complex outermembrane receptor protein